jgi:hypothetical protein
MNKKEAAYVCSLRNELERVKALRWTDPVEPDVLPPTEWGVTQLGRVYYADRVKEACSTATTHGTGTKINAQGPIPLYSTQLLALKALRYSVELDCAEKLQRIDLAIREVK